MGDGRWDASQWTRYASDVAAKPREAIFRSSGIAPDLDPLHIELRESIDSVSNPNSTPVMVFVDVTGSMGHLAETIVKKGLGVIMREIYDRDPIPDPHVLCGAVGDAFADAAPLQVTQFEAEVHKLLPQVERIWIEGGGGGNGGESYAAAWWFAAHKTRCDASRKRGRKGYLFTIGDEKPHPQLTRDQIVSQLGGASEGDVRLLDLHKLVTRHWNVFHLITPTGTTDEQNAVRAWRDVLGERAIEVDDHEALAEVIVSTIQVVEGADPAAVAGSWAGQTSRIVHKAIARLQGPGDDAGSTGFVRF